MRRPAPGYTLLEMVVVMSILALTTAVVAPPSYKMIRSWQESTRVADVIQQLERLPSKAKASGNPMTLDTESSSSSIDLPQDWTLLMDTPLEVRANGGCSEANGTLVTSGQTIELQIQAPFCRVQLTQP